MRWRNSRRWSRSGLPGEARGLCERFPELAGRTTDCAIFGRVVSLSDPVSDGDRVEILRPLLADPKENRRQAAARSRTASSKS
jgi:putative ubiquitin-RnfH superfamily antitoxin RatB of RatAB toxin-antitoxin module